MSVTELSLLRRLPPIRRAREYHLYDHQNRRYLDFWQAGGRALLGHRPDGVLTELKNQLSKGLLAELPSIFERRLEKALALLMPGYAEFRFYRTIESLQSAMGSEFDPGSKLPDPALAETNDVPLALWRPFLDEQRPRTAVPVLPFPFGGSPVIAAFRESPRSEVGPSEIVSPAILAAMSRTVHQLVRFQEEYTEDIWVKVKTPFWVRRGPYLVASCSPEEYAGVFDKLLSAGVLISPSFPGPSIVPAIFTDGELRSLRSVAEA